MNSEIVEFKLISKFRYAVIYKGIPIYYFLSSGLLDSLPRDATWDDILQYAPMGEIMATDVKKVAVKTPIFPKEGADG